MNLFTLGKFRAGAWCAAAAANSKRLRLSRFVLHKEHLSLGWFRLSEQEWLADKRILFLPLFRETA